MSIKVETLERIRNSLTAEYLFHLYPAASRRQYEEDPFLQRKRERILNFIDGLLLMNDVNRHILPLLATLCFKMNKPSFDGVIGIKEKDFETLLGYFTYFTGKSRARFIASYSWILIEDGRPVIRYNKSKLGGPENEVINEYPDFHRAAWLLHEITHILEHWEYFEDKSWTDLKLKQQETGRPLEKEAWEGAVQLLELLKDRNHIPDFNTHLGNTARFNHIRIIFQKYEEEDMKHAVLR